VAAGAWEAESQAAYRRGSVQRAGLSDQRGGGEAGEFGSASGSGEEAQNYSGKGTIIRNDYLFSASRQCRGAFCKSEKR
jgi:hypothetical protein